MTSLKAQQVALSHLLTRAFLAGIFVCCVIPLYMNMLSVYLHVNTAAARGRITVSGGDIAVADSYAALKAQLRYLVSNAYLYICICNEVCTNI